MRVGVHCSVRKGFVAALEEAAGLGCDTLQIFTESPSEWKSRTFSEEDFAQFRSARARLSIDPVVVHSPYLPNLCTSDPAIYERSVRGLIDDLERTENLGGDYLVIHPGAFSPNSTLEAGIATLIRAIDAAFAAVPGRCRLLIENVTGGGRRVGSTARELARILNGVKESKRMGLCFDTCHAYGAGYDLSTEEGVRSTLEEFAAEIGLDRIAVFHVNDSAGTLACRRDLHQNLGEGYVGLAGLKTLFQNPAFRSCAFILETPKKPIPLSDEKNLTILRSLLPVP